MKHKKTDYLVMESNRIEMASRMKEKQKKQ